MNGFLNKESIHFKKVVYMKKIKKMKKYMSSKIENVLKKVKH